MGERVGWVLFFFFFFFFFLCAWVWVGGWVVGAFRVGWVGLLFVVCGVSVSGVHHDQEGK